jgi:hypothetical protein
MKMDLDQAISDYCSFMSKKQPTYHIWHIDDDRQGSKYTRIKCNGGARAFIVMEENSVKCDKGGFFAVGAILKPASWKAPVKNFARGNVLEPASYQDHNYYGL